MSIDRERDTHTDADTHLLLINYIELH